MKLTLRQARTGVELSQEEMAERLGVSTVTYNSYEKDPKKMKVGMLVQFSKVTGIDLSMLKLEG